MSECIALLRGINVGTSKRISMSDLRGLVSDLGHTNVRTLLNSGNVLFQCSRPNAAKLAADIESAISAKHGFSASVTVITAKDLAQIIDENTLLKHATDHARHLVAFTPNPKLLIPLRPMLKETWTPDALAIGSRAAYLWCASGILESRLNQAFARKAGANVTTRNWTTVLKIRAAQEASKAP